MSGKVPASIQRKRGEYQPRTVIDHRVRTVLQAIDADLALDLHALARVVNLSSSRLSHLFKSSMGMSLQSYLANQRLQQAAALLESTQVPVKEVSYRVGYRHAPSFARAFKNAFGSSPNDYRSRQRLLLSDS